jgi:hypothetical protein
MRLVTFKIPAPHGAAECSVIELAGMAGGTKDNVNRWRRQLELAEVSEQEIAQSAQSASGALGDYQYFTLANPENQRAFLAAIIPVGTQTLFVKLACAVPDLAALESDFVTFCSSLERQ